MSLTSDQQIGEIHSDVKHLLAGAIETRRDIVAIYDRQREFSHALTVLQTEHTERVRGGAECSVLVQQPIQAIAGKKALALAGAGGGIGVGFVIITLIVVLKWAKLL